MSLASPDQGGGMVATTPERGDGAWVIVLSESSRFSNHAFSTVFPVSFAQPAASDTAIGKRESETTPMRPCEWWTGFFIKGVSEHLPKNPIEVTRWQNGGVSRTIIIDPARDTRALRPVLRFSTRDIKALRNRTATFILGVTVTAGTKPLLVLGLVGRPDGSFADAAFAPRPGEQGWGGFVQRPGETTEVSFYALDVPASGCRAE
jgi:hypothetical protein